MAKQLVGSIYGSISPGRELGPLSVLKLVALSLFQRSYFGPKVFFQPPGVISPVVDSRHKLKKILFTPKNALFDPFLTNF